MSSAQTHSTRCWVDKTDRVGSLCIASSNFSNWPVVHRCCTWRVHDHEWKKTEINYSASNSNCGKSSPVVSSRERFDGIISKLCNKDVFEQILNFGMAYLFYREHGHRIATLSSLVLPTVILITSLRMRSINNSGTKVRPHCTVRTR
jgi:hypothetical protein